MGLTPNENDEYAIGYTVIRSSKGQPVYVGDHPSIRARYWRWPNWDKDSLYFLSQTQISENNRLKVRLFHDTYKNSMQMYDDDTYQHISDDLSVYKDKTSGLSINFANTSFEKQIWQLTYQYKQDQHHDINKSEKYKDDIHLIAVENKIDVSDVWKLRAGLGYEKQSSRYLPEKFTSSSTSSTNALVESIFHLNEHNSIYGIASIKSRFPTLKDRYSYRMGRAIPNPNLKSERGYNFELGWQGQATETTNINISLFYNRLKNEIQSSYIVDSQNECKKSDVKGYCSQAQNIGKTRHMGVEIGLKQQLDDKWEIGANYTYLNRKDLHDTNNYLLNTPKHKIYGFVQYNINEKINLLAVVNGEKGRRVNYGEHNKILGGFTTVDTKVMWQINKNFLLEAGINNLGDKNYSLADGYPMPGRTIYSNIQYKF